MADVALAFSSRGAANGLVLDLSREGISSAITATCHELAALPLEGLEAVVIDSAFVKAALEEKEPDPVRRLVGRRAGGASSPRVIVVMTRPLSQVRSVELQRAIANADLVLDAPASTDDVVLAVRTQRTFGSPILHGGRGS